MNKQIKQAFKTFFIRISLSLTEIITESVFNLNGSDIKPCKSDLKLFKSEIKLFKSDPFAIETHQKHLKLRYFGSIQHPLDIGHNIYYRK